MTSFPDRPDHDDFWLMAEIVQDLNNAGDDGVAMPRIVGDIDTDSLVYMAEQRALRAHQTLAAMGPALDLEVLFTAVWIEAFKAGAEFQKRRLRSSGGGDTEA